jgi:hypothetical protein
MRRNSFKQISGLAIAAAFVLAPMVAQATPIINGAKIFPRVFNDCPGSFYTDFNGYPGVVFIQDQNNGCFGFANLHNWRLSDDGGATAAVFNNGDSFRFCTDLTLTGNGVAEAGINITPWWSVADGRLNVKTSGEIAAFGGRLPFFSFTGAFGISYVMGETIHLEVIYKPNGLSMANPATIEYIVSYQANNYTSGPLPFDQGNPAEDPPHGQWGILSPAEVGGHFQFLLNDSGPTGTVAAEFTAICYEPLEVIPTVSTTWGGVKARFGNN